MEPALVVEHQRPWVIQLAGLAPLASPGAERLAVERELLHAVVAELANVDVPPAIQRHAVGIGQLPKPAPLLAPYLLQLTRRIEDLDAMVASVSHPQVFVGVEGQGLRPRE